MSYWFDTPPPEGTGGCVAYADTGSAWVAAGRPVAPEGQVERAAAQFVAAARQDRRRASFFAAERPMVGFDALRIGDQPLFSPTRWLAPSTHGRTGCGDKSGARASAVCASAASSRTRCE